MWILKVDKIVSWLIREKAISTDEKELYLYAFHQMWVLLGNLTIAIVMGILFNHLKESIVFLLAYIPLRSYAGGYHARTPARCFILSVLLIVVVLSVISIPNWDELMSAIVCFLSTVCIWHLAPIGDENKPLDELETMVYRSRTRKVLGTLILIAIIFSAMNQVVVVKLVVSAIGVTAVMLILKKLLVLRVVDK